MSREELRTRVLAAAHDMLGGDGLTVGLHHLNMEELIRRVGVPRSSAFAAFGGKEQLMADLMVDTLRPASSTAARCRSSRTDPWRRCGGSSSITPID
ncbi:hypothetical protein A8L33_06475 [Microbacterium aurantiacum]|uniref:HTH tetR-type domain-containing protein n=2 Tax=Microbacterium aurantiacum TaxID=162393 RepID=A0A0M9VKL8_9MICO|nr:hypothetical protein A8L33_06475 [Microbacterium chocolatum]KOS10213.1 hypothetical protein XI38_12015 [Microbacterium chocolatum]